MKRAVLMFDGPKRFSKHCSGCALHDAAERAGDTCPIWGSLYRETDGPKDGLMCRDEGCVDNEIAVADPRKRDSIWRDLEKGP